MEENANEQSTTIEDGDVYWEMNWGSNDLGKPEKEMIFNEEKALARLLGEGIIFVNSHWWEDDWPDQAKKITSLNVNCNDIFAWACADGEEVEFDEIQALYDLWHKDRRWGAAKWCAIKRNQKPQPPVIKAMKENGSWDDVMEHLEKNYQDAEVQAAFAKLNQKRGC